MRIRNSAVNKVVVYSLIGAFSLGYGCREEPATKPSRLNIPETTKIIDDKAASDLLAMSEDKSELTFSLNSEYAQNLNVGEVVMAGVYDNIPVGLLREVTSKTKTSSGIVVTTAQATLEDAVKNGTFDETASLTPEYLDHTSHLMDGVSLGLIEAPLKADLTNKQILSIDFEEVELYNCGENCKVTLDGDLKLGLEMRLKLEMSSSQVRYVRFTMEGTEDFKLELTGESSAEFNKKLPPITPVRFSPLVFMAGVVPVVIVPEMTIIFGAEAQGSLSLETSVSQGTSSLYGLEYHQKPAGKWTTIQEFEDHFDFNPPTFTKASASAEAYAKLLLTFKLYGVAGPSTGAKGYVKGEVEPLSEPWCTLSAGLEVNAGFKVEALGKTLSDYEKVVYEYEKELYKCCETSECKTCTDECDCYTYFKYSCSNLCMEQWALCSNPCDEAWWSCSNTCLGKSCTPSCDSAELDECDKSCNSDSDNCDTSCDKVLLDCAKSCCEGHDNCHYIPDYGECLGGP